MHKSFMLLLMGLVLFVSCKKESTRSHCQLLKDGMAAGSVNEIRSSVNGAISQLQHKEHIESNLSSLATLLSSYCGISAEVLCFNCIYTNPGQSEIKVSFISSGTTLTKVIDITNSASNRMVFAGVHD